MFEVGDIVIPLEPEELLSIEGLKKNSRGGYIYKGQSYDEYRLRGSHLSGLLITETKGPLVNVATYRTKVYPEIFLKKVDSVLYIRIKILNKRGVQENLLYFDKYGWVLNGILYAKFPISTVQRKEFVLVSINGLSKTDFYKVIKGDKKYTGFKRYLSKFG